MKLLIDISEELYKDIQSRDWKNGGRWFSEEWKAIHNGIPLDKLKADIELLKADGLANMDAVLYVIDRYRNEVST